MKTKIISQKKNPLLEREEFVMEIESDSTPSKEEIINDLGKEEELTIVEKITGIFGAQKFIAEITVYDNLKARKKNVIIPKKIKKKMEEERKKALEEEKKKKEAEAKAKTEEEKKAEEEKKESKETKEPDKTEEKEIKEEETR